MTIRNSSSFLLPRGIVTNTKLILSTSREDKNNPKRKRKQRNNMSEGYDILTTLLGNLSNPHKDMNNQKGKLQAEGLQFILQRSLSMFCEDSNMSDAKGKLEAGRQAS
ncbi:hypothetical protein J6590_027630 [Homalodisca vitripennis]|nr:hypothetical protein J6590_027630 [Homalodisca vitripennis]